MANQKRFRTVLMLLVTLLLSSLIAFSACAKKKTDDTDTDDNDTSTTEPADEQTIRNGNFEFGTSGDSVVFPVYTGINWTRSRDSLAGEDADASDITSGIIDTEQEAFDKIEDAKRPIANPGVHEGAAEGETKVLMIANKSTKTDTHGATAQKFTSTTTLSLTQNTYVKISFWVLTQGLEFESDDSKDESGNPVDKGIRNCNGDPGDPAADSEFGANVSVIGTLGSVSQTAVKLVNINTYGEWKQYSFYVKASDYTSSSVQIAVGLGLASTTVVGQAVAGRAYFDDFTYELVSKDIYDDAVGSEMVDGGQVSTVAQTDSAEEYKTVDLGPTCREGASETARSAAIELNKKSVSAADLGLTVKGGVSDFLTKDDRGTQAPSDPANDGLQGLGTLADVKAKDFFAPAFPDGGTIPFDETSQAVYIGIASPSSYTVPVTSARFKLAAQSSQTDGYTSYYMLSFWVKTSKIRNGTFAPVSVYLLDLTDADGADYAIRSSFTAIDTTPAEGAEKGENEPDFGDWRRYTFFVTNNFTSAERYFSLRFSFGPTEIYSVAEPDLDYAEGYAIFSGFTDCYLTKEEYNAATTGDYAVKTSLYAGYYGDSSDTGFDTAQSSEADAYRYRPSMPAHYTGVPANHTTLGGENGAVNYLPEGVTAGLVHSDYAKDYEDAALTDAPWNTDGFFAGASKRTLMIRTTGKSYGYYGASATISANSFVTISVRVRTSGGAKASLYLIDLATDRTLRNGETETNPDRLSPMKFRLPASREELYKDAASEREYSFKGISSADGWTTYTFYIATGAFSKTYRIELWNGERNTETTDAGYVFFDLEGTSLQRSSSESDFKAALKDAGSWLDALDETAAAANRDKFTQFPIADDDTTEYKEQTVYLVGKEYDGEDADKAPNALFFDLRTAEITDELETDETDTSDSEDSGDLSVPTRNQSVWLLISSLILAVALIVTIALILVRKASARRKRRFIRARSGYDPSKRNTAASGKPAKRAKAPRASDYDDEDGNAADESADEAETPERKAKKAAKPRFSDYEDDDVTADELAGESAEERDTDGDGAPAADEPAETADETAADENAEKPAETAPAEEPAENAENAENGDEKN